jgi:hypothetical protein
MRYKKPVPPPQPVARVVQRVSPSNHVVPNYMKATKTSDMWRVNAKKEPKSHSAHVISPSSRADTPTASLIETRAPEMNSRVHLQQERIEYIRLNNNAHLFKSIMRDHMKHQEEMRLDARVESVCDFFCFFFYFLTFSFIGKDPKK